VSFTRFPKNRRIVGLSEGLENRPNGAFIGCLDGSFDVRRACGRLPLAEAADAAFVGDGETPTAPAALAAHRDAA
jgi:hypothetical protein